MTSWITVAALQRPDDLATLVVEHTGCSRSTALKTLRKLTDLQWLVRSGSRARPVYGPGLLRQVVRRYPLQGLSEDLPWVRDFAPHFALPKEISRLAQHAFTELVNNAVDHSGGMSVTVSMRQTPTHLQLLVSDDGCGVFDKIRDTFDIPDPALVALELGKGKLTSQPDRHSGRGLFFTSQLADMFELHANEHTFQHNDWVGNTLARVRAMRPRGSSVFVAIALDTTRTLDEVLRRFSLDGEGYAFERTVVPLRLLTQSDVGLESRAQARRAAARLQQFRRADVDFDGIADVGPAFADELFRVFRNQHRDIQLVPCNMAPRVAALVASVTGTT